MKTYVLTLSKTFMKGHVRAGEPTNFKAQFLAGTKIHTIRSGEYWLKVVGEVNAGKALLSVREWSGKPYASKQVELTKLYKLGAQQFEIQGWQIYVDGLQFDNHRRLVGNDGLTLPDFISWFKYPTNFKGCIIHFTEFRYESKS